MELSAWSTGIVSGGCGKRSNPSCRGEGAVARSLFGARDSKDSPLLYRPSRCYRVVTYGRRPDAGDNGNRRSLMVTIARGTNALDHSIAHAQCIVQGLLARCGCLGSVKWIANLSRQRFSLCTQGKGTDPLEEASGRADVSRGGVSPLLHSSGIVSRSWQPSRIKTMIMSPPAQLTACPLLVRDVPLPPVLLSRAATPLSDFNLLPPTYTYRR